MKLCPKCQTHNLQSAHTCHQCTYSFSQKGPSPVIKTAVLLGMLGCAPLPIGEPEYGVPVVDNDGDGLYEFEDCDDSDPTVLGGTDYHLDQDGDGFGLLGSSIIVCPGEEIEEGWVEDGTDCDDSDPNIHPEAEETPGDGVDSNCNDLDDE